MCHCLTILIHKLIVIQYAILFNQKMNRMRLNQISSYTEKNFRL